MFWTLGLPSLLLNMMAQVQSQTMAPVPHGEVNGVAKLLRPECMTVLETIQDRKDSRAFEVIYFKVYCKL